MNIQEKLKKQGYKEIYGYNSYYVNKEGNFIKLRGEKVLNINLNKNIDGAFKVSIVNNSGKRTTLAAHKLVYETFIGEIDNTEDKSNQIVFLDGNKENISLNNLISLKELREYYLSHHAANINKSNM